MATVLVTGGTGHLGQELVPKLVANGHAVRVLSRRADAQVAAEARVVQGDLRTGDGLAAATAGVDVIVNAATDSTTAGTFMSRKGRKTDEDGTRRLLDAAKAGGTPHVLHISIVGIERVPYPYYKTKVVAENVVTSSGLPYTIFRSTQWHTLGWDFCERFAKMPIVPAPKGMRMQLLDPTEVAARAAELVDARPPGYATEMGGPAVLEFRDIMRAYLRAMGKRRWVVSLPLPGKSMAAFKAGHNLAPDHADGTITWDEWLAVRVATI